MDDVSSLGLGFSLFANDVSFSSAFNMAEQTLGSFQQSLGIAGLAVTELNRRFGSLIKGMGDKFLGTLSSSAKQAGSLQNKLFQIAAISGQSSETVEELADKFVEMSSVLPLSANTLADVGIAASRMGLFATEGMEGVLALSGEASRLATISKDLNEELAASQLGVLLKIFKSEGDPFNKRISSMSSLLTDVANSANTVQGELSRIISRVGAMGASMGMSAPEVAAFSAAARDLGVEWNVAATGLMRGIGQMSIKTKKFAEIMGVPEQALAGLIRQSPADAFMAFLEVLKEAGPEANKLLAHVGLAKPTYIPVFTGLANSMDNLQRIMQIANRSFEKGTGNMELFAKQSESMTNQAATLSGSIENIYIQLGRIILPLKLIVTKFMTKLVSLFFDLTPPLRFAIIGFLALTGVMLKMVGAALIALATLAMFRWMIVRHAADLGLVTSKTVSFGVAMKAVAMQQVQQLSMLSQTWMTFIAASGKGIFDTIIGWKMMIAANFRAQMALKDITVTQLVYNMTVGKLVTLWKAGWVAAWTYFVDTMKLMKAKIALSWASYRAVLAEQGVWASLGFVARSSLLGIKTSLISLRTTLHSVFAGTAFAGIGTAITALLPALGVLLVAGVALYAIVVVLKDEWMKLWRSMEYFAGAVVTSFWMIWDVVKVLAMSFVALIYPAILMLGLVIEGIAATLRIVGSVIKVVFSLAWALLQPVVWLLKIFQLVMIGLGGVIWLAFKPFVILLEFIAGWIEKIIWAVETLVDAFKKAAKSAFFKEMQPALKEIAKLWEEISGIFTDIMSIFTGNQTSDAQAFLQAVSGVVALLADAVGLVAKVVRSALQPVVYMLKQLREFANWIRSWFTDEIPKISKTVEKAVEVKKNASGGGGSFQNVPLADVPKFAYGGIAATPMIASVAELGPEAILPLGKLSDLVKSSYMKGRMESENTKPQNVIQKTIHINSDNGVLAKTLAEGFKNLSKDSGEKYGRENDDIVINMTIPITLDNKVIDKVVYRIEEKRRKKNYQRPGLGHTGVN